MAEEQTKPEWRPTKELAKFAEDLIASKKTSDYEGGLQAVVRLQLTPEAQAQLDEGQKLFAVLTQFQAKWGKELVEARSYVKRMIDNKSKMTGREYDRVGKKALATVDTESDKYAVLMDSIAKHASVYGDTVLEIRFPVITDTDAQGVTTVYATDPKVV